MFTILKTFTIDYPFIIFLLQSGSDVSDIWGGESTYITINYHQTKLKVYSFHWQYQVAQLFAIAEESKNNTGGGKSIEVLKNEPFEGKPLLGGKFSKGQYTYKIYHLAR